MYATRFDALFERGREAVLAGAVQCQVPPVDGGNRWVMSVVMRPDSATARRIGEITREAMTVAGKEHWPTGTADSSHFTLRALEEHRVSVRCDHFTAAALDLRSSPSLPAAREPTTPPKVRAPLPVVGERVGKSALQVHSVQSGYLTLQLGPSPDRQLLQD